MGNQSWHEGFTLYRAIHGVFNVKSNHEVHVKDVLRDLGLPTETQLTMFSPLYRSTPLLDGFVIELSNYGFPAGYLMDGLRVVGYASFRVMCIKLGLAPPARRFKHELHLLTEPELLEALAQQQEADASSLVERARVGLGVLTRTDLAVLVHKLFGDDLLPEKHWMGLDEALPADGEWGSQGFSIKERERFEQASIGLAQALAWREAGVRARLAATLKARGLTPASLAPWKELGCTPEQAGDLSAFGVDSVRPWLLAGVRPATVVYCLYWAGISLDRILAFTQAGCPEGLASSFIDGGLQPADAAAYAKEPWGSSKRVGYFARAGLRVADAKQWSETGLNSYWVWRAVIGGHALDEVKALIKSGKSRREIEQELSKGYSPPPFHRRFPNSQGARDWKQEHEQTAGRA